MKIDRLYNIHTHFKKSTDKITSFRSFHVDDKELCTDQYFTVGIHPWHIKNCNLQLSELCKYIHHHNCVAIGEAGIDKLRGPSIELQEEAFIKQVQISEDILKPLVIHCVKAFHEIIRIKQTLQPSVPWIIHGFNKKPELAKQLISHGFYLSLGSNWINKKEQLVELLRQLPSAKVFFESDDMPDEEVVELYQCANELANFSAIIAKNVNLVFNI